MCDALAAFVAAGALCFIGPSLRAQAPAGTMQRQSTKVPRLEGIRLGAAGVRQRVEGVQYPGWDQVSGDGYALTLGYGLHSRLALLVEVATAPAAFAPGRFDVADKQLLLHYQVTRGWHGYPYFEAGATRRRFSADEGGPGPSHLDGWMPVLGAGLRFPISPAFAAVIGARVNRGALDHSSDSSGTHSMPAVLTSAYTIRVGAEWRVSTGPPPKAAYLFMQRPNTRGLGLIAATTYGEGGNGGGLLMMGSGTTFGASWGLSERVSIAWRVSKERLRYDDTSDDIVHSDLVARYALRGLVTGLRPYVEAGTSKLDHVFRSAGIDQPAQRGTVRLFGAGLLYGVQPDLDFDLGASLTTHGAAALGVMDRTFRLRAGFEYRPAR